MHSGSYTEGWADGIQVLPYSKDTAPSNKKNCFKYLINGAAALLRHFLPLCLPCQVAAPRERSISTATTQQIEKQYEGESIATVGEGEDGAQLPSLDHTEAY